MIIPHHIKILLSEYDCVIIPDFGAFVADYRPPVLDGDQSAIPGKDILFNRQLTRNDGLLINAIIEADNCSYEEARKSIATDIADIKKQLDSGETFTFEGIGQMMLDETGFIQFLVADDNSCLLDAYGLQAIHLDKIDKDTPHQELTSNTIDNNNKRTFISITAAAAVVALLLIFSPPLSDKAVVDKAGISFDTTPAEMPSLSQEQRDLPKADQEALSLPLSRKNATETDTEKTKTQQESAKGETITNILPEKAYHIIIASLPNQKLAEQYVYNFTKKYDFDTIQTLSGNERYRISVANFSQKKEAIAFVKSLRLLNPKFGDAWVLAVSSGQ